MLLVHARVVAQAPLVGSTHVVVLHPKADVVVDLALVALDHELDLDDAAWRNQDLPHPIGEIEDVSSVVEVAMTSFEHDGGLAE